MKALFLAAAAAVALPAAAQSASLTLGGPLAVQCYEAALARNTDRFAREACDRALTEEPLKDSDRAATHVNRGVVRMVAGEHAAAEADFDRAAAIDPTLADSWLNKAFLRLRRDDGAAALPLLQKAIDLRARRQALAYFARAIAYEQTGNYRAAYADLQRARQLEPGWDEPAKALSRYRVRTR